MDDPELRNLKNFMGAFIALTIIAYGFIRMRVDLLVCQMLTTRVHKAFIT